MGGIYCEYPAIAASEWPPHLRIPDYVQQCDNVWTACQVLQYLDFPLNLLLLYGFEYLDDALVVVEDVYAFKDFRVLSSADLSQNLVVVLGAGRRVNESV